MAEPSLLGDLRERADGGFDGWCWAPDRPDERLIVDLLVNDTVAASMVAAIFRRDLAASGHGDGRHGFALRVPPNLPEAAEECLITGRERRSGAIFGRVLRTARGMTPVGGERMQRADQIIAETWQDFAAARRTLLPNRDATRLRAAFAALGARLAAGPRAGTPYLARPFDGAGLPAGRLLVLPDLARPALSVVLPVSDAAAALRRIAALAAGAALAHAEIIVVDTGDDPLAALLPARVRNLRYLRHAPARGTADIVNLAAAHAGGARLAVLGAGPERPSAAALLALVRLVATQPEAVWLGPASVDSCARVGAPVQRRGGELPARLGLSFCLSRAQWDMIGPLEAALQDGAALECADLAFRARLLGVTVLALGEPAAGQQAPPTPPASALAMRRALAAFRDRWGQDYPSSAVA